MGCFLQIPCNAAVCEWWSIILQCREHCGVGVMGNSAVRKGWWGGGLEEWENVIHDRIFLIEKDV